MVNGVVLDLAHLENRRIIEYVNKVRVYWEEHGQTTELQVDTLIVLFRLTEDNRIFVLLFDLHKKLLLSILNSKYKKYEAVLLLEDKNDLFNMATLEFYRRIMFYKIPPEAPFPRYVKLWFKQWLNVYAKSQGNKNKPYLLVGDKHDVLRYLKDERY